jgi:hypothetical protein
LPDHPVRDESRRTPGEHVGDSSAVIARRHFTPTRIRWHG